MIKPKWLVNLTDKQTLTHIAFWLLLYGYYVSSNWSYFDENKAALMEKYLIKTGLLIPFSYGVIYVFIPVFLNKSRRLLFVISSLFSVYLVYLIYTLFRYYYFDLKYPSIYKKFNLLERVTDFSLFFSELYWFLFPTIILIALKYYKDQEEIVTLREQKKIMELNSLKNQINPHFLFNTLNNLYTLALKKSDRAPEIIMKLSKMLDYMLYKCQADFVPISGEVNLLENYIALEKVRYSKRVSINLATTIQEDVNIAPLLLLTFVENAFKHGVSQEIKIANIDISLQASKTLIEFEIKNSKPTVTKSINQSKRAAIGLKNIKKQLALLYPNTATLTTNETDTHYLVQLKLIPYAL